MNKQNQRQTRQARNNTTYYDVRLHVNTSVKMNFHAKVAYGDSFEHPSLQSFDLDNTAVLDVLVAIEDLMRLSLFQRCYPGHIHMNGFVGMKTWKRRKNGSIIKQEVISILTEEDVETEEEKIAIKEKWVNHIKEHGEKKDDGKFVIDVGIIACRKEFSEPKQIRKKGAVASSPQSSASSNQQPITTIITTTDNNKRSNDNISTLTPAIATTSNSTSQKKLKTKKKVIKFVAPEKLKISIVHPVNYDSTKGIYKMAYAYYINSFYLDFDEFVEYRVGDENAELFLDLTDEIIDEDKLKTHLLQPLKHHVGKFIFKDVKCKSFYEDKIGMKSRLFILLELQKYTQMTKIERSIDLDTYLRKFLDRKKSWEEGIMRLSSQSTKSKRKQSCLFFVWLSGLLRLVRH